LFSDVWDAIKSVKEKVERFYNTPEVKFAIAVIMIANGVGEVGDPTAGILNLTKAAHDLVNTSNQSSDIGFYGQSGSSGRYLTDGGSPISASAPGNRDAKGSGYSYFHPSFYSQASGVLSDVSSGFLRTNIGAITRALNVSKWFELRERAFDPFNNKESYKHRKAHWDYGHYIGNDKVAGAFAYILELVQFPWYNTIDTWSKIAYGEPGEFQPSSFNPYAPGGRFDSRQDRKDTIYGAMGIPLYLPDGSIYYGR
jgi:hypothetical protein